MSQPKDPTCNAQEQTIMFADALPSLFDSIHAGLHEIIRSQVSTLPIIQSSSLFPSSDGQTEESCDEKIYKNISKVYAKHIDMAQLYAEQELFCLDKNWKKKKREKAVHLFLELEENHDDGNLFEKKHPEDSHETHKQVCNTEMHPLEKELDKEVVLKYKIPSCKDEVPSAEEFSFLREDIARLRQELRDCIVEKQRYHRQYLELEHAHASSIKVEESISSNLIGAKGQDGDEKETLQKVKQVVDGQKELKRLIGHGQELMEEMDRLTHEKKQRAAVGVAVEDGNSTAHDPNETLEFSQAMKAKAMQVARQVMMEEGGAASGETRKKRTLEDDYKERKESTKIRSDVLTLFQK
jgi:hypothetical protein